MSAIASGCEKLARLRALFATASPKGISAFVVPSGDAHQSEYVAACDERRAAISNFTGSAGTAVVTPSAALLWTDGRYYLQASQQLSSEWTLMKAGLRETPSLEVRGSGDARDSNVWAMPRKLRRLENELVLFWFWRVILLQVKGFPCHSGFSVICHAWAFERRLNAFGLFFSDFAEVACGES